MLALEQRLHPLDLGLLVAGVEQQLLDVAGVARLLILAPAQVAGLARWIVGAGHLPPTEVMRPGSDDQRLVGVRDQLMRPISVASRPWARASGRTSPRTTSSLGSWALAASIAAIAASQPGAQTAHSESPTSAVNGPVSS